MYYILLEEHIMLHKNIIRHIREATPQKEESLALTLAKESLGAIAFLVCCMGMLFLWIVF